VSVHCTGQALSYRVEANICNWFRALSLARSMVIQVLLSICTM
jgi:hypothetical protein